MASPDGPVVRLHATVDTAGGLDSGVFVLPFNRDFGLQPGAEVGNAYLPTASGTRVELQGNLGAAGSIQVLVNDVSAAKTSWTSRADRAETGEDHGSQGLLDALTEAQNTARWPRSRPRDPATPVDETTEVEQLAAELADHKYPSRKAAPGPAGPGRGASRVEDRPKSLPTPRRGVSSHGFVTGWLTDKRFLVGAAVGFLRASRGEAGPSRAGQAEGLTVGRAGVSLGGLGLIAAGGVSPGPGSTIRPAVRSRRAGPLLRAGCRRRASRSPRTGVRRGT
jgi:hypothetical protein